LSSFHQNKANFMPKTVWLLILSAQCITLLVTGASNRITSLFHPQLMCR